MIEHHSLVNCAQPADFPYSAYCGEKRGSAALGISSLSFDMSVFDSLLPLMNGMTVVYATEKEIHDPSALAKLIRDNRVDTMSATPSYLMNLLGFEEFRDAAKNLHTVVVGAEAFPPVLFSDLKKLAPNLTILNGYGPTECTMTCCSKHLQSGRNITIGGPAANVAFYTVDRFGNVLPPYACGELIICGECVGRGYIRIPEKNAAFFTLRGLPAYRSGDIARLNRDGEVELFGRSDSQVKLRGLRIELDEIERCICSFKDVTQSRVIVRSNGTEDYLAAFFTASLPVDTAKLSEYLRTKLTYYMVPAAIMQLDSMPLTANGKVDSKALPEIRPEKKKPGKRTAKKLLEQELCRLFGSVLSLDEYYADDNFFELGGTSLSASKIVMQLMSRGLRVEYQDIFDNPTPEMLADFIGSRNSEKGTPDAEAAAENSASGYTNELRHNALEYAAEVKREPLGNVLLAGAVGFLGIHVLRELLESETGSILCLIRKDRYESSKERLRNMLMYYFSSTFDEALENRITVLDADITDSCLEELLAPYPIDTVINCAANVKHYSADDSIERINVRGVENLIRASLSHSARMVQISTTSVPGVHTEESWKKRTTMHENELFVINDMENQYGISKYRAELKMLDAVRNNGLRGKIIRVGNLMGRYSDGEFQANFHTNAFMNSLRGFAAIGKCPVSHATDPMSFSPVDMTAKAVVLLSGTNDCFTAFHADNRFGFDEWQLIEAANRSGIDIRPVPDDEYYADYYRMLSDESANSYLQGLMTNDRPDLHAVETDNTFTANILYRLGFSWPITDISYLEKAIVSLKTLGFFDLPAENP